MTNHNPIESSLERLRETVSLRTSEKDMHRENLVAFMARGRAPKLSPYAWLLNSGTRYVATFVLVLAVSGTGVVSAAEGARPGDVLYAVKLKVNETTRAALILDPEEKTQYAITLTDLRLKEFALAVVAGNPDSETTTLITESLADSIAEVSEDIGELTVAGDADEALSVNGDLQSVLSAHSLVLDTVEEQNLDATEAFNAINASVDAGIASTENAEQGIENALESSLNDEQSVVDQALDTEVSLIELRDQILEESASVNADDKAIIEESLVDVTAIIEDAKNARSEGNRKDAFILYTEADQRLNELKTLIEADRDLGIGVIDSGAP